MKCSGIEIKETKLNGRWGFEAGRLGTIHEVSDPFYRVWGPDTG